MKMEKRLSYITVTADDGAEQVFSLADVKARRALSIAGWIRRIENLGYTKIHEDWIS